MYFKFRGENPFISGNARFKSPARRSITLEPQLSRFLAVENVAANLPVKQNQFTIDGQGSMTRSRLDTMRRIASISSELVIERSSWGPT